jgi:hypothetical protein
MCSCCCPPAITALFYLWVRSGFSKGTVAGALTFFPPDPPLYRFQRVKDGRDLPDEDAADADEENGVVVDDNSDDDESDLGTFEIDTKSSRQSKKTNGNESSKKTPRTQQQQQQQQGSEADQSQDPIAAMTERSNKLRARAKHRAAIDSRDAKSGVTYRFIPDTDSLGPPPAFHGVITPLKIGPQKLTGSYIAALLYQLPPEEITPNTKTILYSHGNATDVGAMSGLQAIMAADSVSVAMPGPQKRPVLLITLSCPPPFKISIYGLCRAPALTIPTFCVPSGYKYG